MKLLRCSGWSEPGAKTVTGAEMQAMAAAELDAIIERVRAFARIDPEHKLTIVSTLHFQTSDLG